MFSADNVPAHPHRNTTRRGPRAALPRYSIHPLSDRPRTPLLCRAAPCEDCGRIRLCPACAAEDGAWSHAALHAHECGVIRALFDSGEFQVEESRTLRLLIRLLVLRALERAADAEPPDVPPPGGGYHDLVEALCDNQVVPSSLAGGPHRRRRDAAPALTTPPPRIACRKRCSAAWATWCARRDAPPPPPLVLCGHAASLTPY